MKQNTDNPAMSFGKAMYSVEIVADSLESTKNYHEKDKCQAAEFWLRESVFTMSEYKMDIDENYGNVVPIITSTNGRFLK